MDSSQTRSNIHSGWTPQAIALAQQARCMSGDKLETLVRRLQRMTGNSRTSCWRFVIQHGLRTGTVYRRWTEEEIEEAREELTKSSVEEVAKRLKRTPKALRCALNRRELSVRDIRCDSFSIASLAHVLHVRREEITRWIEAGWLPARRQSKGRLYTITADDFAHLYKKHLHDLLDRHRVTNLSLFEAFYQYCYVPKHTVGEQLLDVRRDKREREAYAASAGSADKAEETEDEYEEDQARISLSQCEPRTARG